MSADAQPPRGCGHDGPHGRLLLHTTLTGLLAAVVSPILLVGLGAFAVLREGPRPLPVTLLVLGLVVGVLAGLTLPRHVIVDVEGITRVCPLRRQHLPWSDIAAIERGPGSRTARARRAAPSEPAEVSGGLLARSHGRRRWMLTDRVESRQQYDELAAIVARAAPATSLDAPRPHAHAPPTDLYRRRHSR